MDGEDCVFLSQRPSVQHTPHVTHTDTRQIFSLVLYPGLEAQGFLVKDPTIPISFQTIIHTAGCGMTNGPLPTQPPSMIEARRLEH